MKIINSNKNLSKFLKYASLCILFLSVITNSAKVDPKNKNLKSNTNIQKARKADTQTEEKLINPNEESNPIVNNKQADLSTASADAEAEKKDEALTSNSTTSKDAENSKKELEDNNIKLNSTAPVDLNSKKLISQEPQDLTKPGYENIKFVNSGVSVAYNYDKNSYNPEKEQFKNPNIPNFEKFKTPTLVKCLDKNAPKYENFKKEIVTSN